MLNQDFTVSKFLMTFHAFTDSLSIHTRLFSNSCSCLSVTLVTGCNLQIKITFAHVSRHPPFSWTWLFTRLIHLPVSICRFVMILLQVVASLTLFLNLFLIITKSVWFLLLSPRLFHVYKFRFLLFVKGAANDQIIF